MNLLQRQQSQFIESKLREYVLHWQHEKQQHRKMQYSTNQELRVNEGAQKHLHYKFPEKGKTF